MKTAKLQGIKMPPKAVMILSSSVIKVEYNMELFLHETSKTFKQFQQGLTSMYHVQIRT